MRLKILTTEGETSEEYSTEYAAQCRWLAFKEKYPYIKGK